MSNTVTDIEHDQNQLHQHLLQIKDKKDISILDVSVCV